jgi:uncharacterized membrane protein
MSAYKGKHTFTRTGGIIRTLGKTNRYFSKGENAQALVIVALVFFVLLAFVGLLTDVGSVYVTYSRLKNAVDSAAVASTTSRIRMRPEIRRQKLPCGRQARFEHVTDISSLIVYSAATRCCHTA